MTRRESGRALIVGYPAQPDWLGRLDQRAQDAAPLGQFTDGPHSRLVHSYMHELLEKAVGAYDAKCTVFGPDQVSSSLDDAT
jgi:hypothetical protein